MKVRRKTTVIVMMLAGVMMTASLTGCGTRAEATNREEPDMQEETIIAGSNDESVATSEETIVGGTEEKNETGSDSAQEQAESVLNDDITDGNIVLYGGEKRKVQFLLGNIDEYEEVSIELTNVEADIPLYSGEGRLCGSLKEGGSIMVTEHGLTTVWYRFKNPIEGTEHDYLYIQRFEMVTPSDRKAFIEEELLTISRAEVLNAPEEDMGCHEFSVPRQDYSKDGTFLYTDEFDATQYRTFYVECTRNGDFFDYKVYYK